MEGLLASLSALAFLLGNDESLPGSLSSDGPHSSLESFFDSHFSATAWRENGWEDYLTEPPVLLPVALGAGAAAVSPWDRRWEGHFHGEWGDRPWIGLAAGRTVMAASLLAGIFDPATGRTAWDEFFNEAEAYGITAGTVTTLKVLVRRHRPGSTGQRGSFPSSDSALAFTAASLLERDEGMGLGLPAYGLAGVTALSRVEVGQHYPSDVLAGAAIGVFTAEVMDALHFGTGRRGHGIGGPELTIDVGRGRSTEIGVVFPY